MSEIGIAVSSTLLQRKAQVYQQVLSQHVYGPSPWLHQAVGRLAAHPGNPIDSHYAAPATLYNAMLQQANLLSYMDQFKALGGVVLLAMPLILMLKRPETQKHVELEAH